VNKKYVIKMRTGKRIKVDLNEKFKIKEMELSTIEQKHYMYDNNVFYIIRNNNLTWQFKNSTTALYENEYNNIKDKEFITREEIDQIMYRKYDKEYKIVKTTITKQEKDDDNKEYEIKDIEIEVREQYDYEQDIFYIIRFKNNPHPVDWRFNKFRGSLIKYYNNYKNKTKITKEEIYNIMYNRGTIENKIENMKLNENEKQ
jgi:hypothetical protein